MAKFYKMAKCVFSWPAVLKMAKTFEIGHEMANLATLLDLCHVAARYPMAAFFLTLHGSALAQTWLTVQDSSGIKKLESTAHVNTARIFNWDYL